MEASANLRIEAPEDPEQNKGLKALITAKAEFDSASEAYARAVATLDATLKHYVPAGRYIAIRPSVKASYAVGRPGRPEAQGEDVVIPLRGHYDNCDCKLVGPAVEILLVQQLIPYIADRHLEAVERAARAAYAAAKEYSISLGQLRWQHESLKDQFVILRDGQGRRAGRQEAPIIAELQGMVVAVEYFGLQDELDPRIKYLVVATGEGEETRFYVKEHSRIIPATWVGWE